MFLAGPRSSQWNERTTKAPSAHSEGIVAAATARSPLSPFAPYAIPASFTTMLGSLVTVMPLRCLAHEVLADAKVPQGATSALSLASQAAPPLGDTAMLRLLAFHVPAPTTRDAPDARNSLQAGSSQCKPWTDNSAAVTRLTLVPPSQETLHVDHCSQSLQRQSTTWQWNIMFSFHGRDMHLPVFEASEPGIPRVCTAQLPGAGLHLEGVSQALTALGLSQAIHPT